MEANLFLKECSPTDTRKDHFHFKEFAFETVSIAFMLIPGEVQWLTW